MPPQPPPPETEGNRRASKGGPNHTETEMGEGTHPSGDRFEHETADNRRTGKDAPRQYERDQGDV